MGFRSHCAITLFLSKNIKNLNHMEPVYSLFILEPLML